jgi:hypothetical protein
MKKGGRLGRRPLQRKSRPEGRPVHEREFWVGEKSGPLRKAGPTKTFRVGDWDVFVFWMGAQVEAYATGGGVKKAA